MDNIIVKPGFLASLLRAVGLVKVDSDGKVEHSAGADFVEDMGFRGGYDPKAALSALAAFPWPYSCVQAISTDLSKVPLKAFRGRGADAEVLDSHPVLDLLEQPSTRVNGVLFRRQLYTDMVLTGNAFILIAGTGSEPTALIRLHPSRVNTSVATATRRCTSTSRSYTFVDRPGQMTRATSGALALSNRFTMTSELRRARPSSRLGPQRVVSRPASCHRKKKAIAGAKSRSRRSVEPTRAR